MTSYNEVYGTFADPDKAGYTVLRRNYEQDPDSRRIKDLTTYIDPTKYNYAFASNDLEEQNFWVQIGMNIQARRKCQLKLFQIYKQTKSDNTNDVGKGVGVGKIMNK